MPGFKFSTFGGGIDPTAIIGNPPEMRTWVPVDPMFRPTIHETARVEAYCTVDAGEKRSTFIGARTWLMKRVHVGHDASIGTDCELAPGTVLCGYVEIGDRVKIGVNASVLPYVKIGDDARVGAGAVVTKDVAAGDVVVGNPARVLVKA